jgi:predicted Zn-dependent protease
MIKKIILQGLLILIAFVGLFLALSKVDFMTLFHVKEIQNTSVNKIGDLIWEEIESTEEIITNDSIIESLDKLIAPICEKNNIQRDSLKIHLVENTEVNAFALPDNHLVVYSGLINQCKNQEALQGVLGHEMAHIVNNHVIKKLSKEIGLTVLLSAVTGGKGSAIIKKIVKTLSATAYDRSLEKDADMTSIRYLINAQINPEPMADFMFELANNEKRTLDFSWMETHPESKERANYILAYLKGKKYQKKQTISNSEWASFKTLVAKEILY